MQGNASSAQLKALKDVVDEASGRAARGGGAAGQPDAPVTKEMVEQEGAWLSDLVGRDDEGDDADVC
jgi:hypothetical protein